EDVSTTHFAAKGIRHAPLQLGYRGVRGKRRRRGKPPAPVLAAPRTLGPVAGRRRPDGRPREMHPRPPHRRTHPPTPPNPPPHRRGQRPSPAERGRGLPSGCRPAPPRLRTIVLG